MFDAITKRIRKWKLATRMTAFYIIAVGLSATFLFAGYSRVGGVFFGLLVGVLLSGLTYKFVPYSASWSTLKSICIKSLHRFILMSGFFALTYFFFVEEGALIKEDFTFMDQFSGLMLVAFGVIFSGVVLGKGRFTPEQNS